METVTNLNVKKTQAYTVRLSSIFTHHAAEVGNLKLPRDVSLRGKFLKLMGGAWCERKERE